MTSTDRLVSIHADESFPTRVQAAINALIAAGIIGKADAATVNTALAAKAPLASPAFTGTPTGITKTHVGLSNVDNTSDANKPVSTAQAAAISAAVSGLVNGAPGALDTLNELSAALGNDASFATTVTTALASKVNSSTYTAGLATKQALQQVAATVTADGAAVVNKHNPVDATAAARTITLPTGQAEGTQVSIEKVDASANTVSVTGSIRGVGSTTISLSYLSESLMLRADSAGSWWPVAGHRTKVSLDARTQAIIDAGTVRTKTRVTIANHFDAATSASPSYSSHRADSALAPENTLEALRSVLQFGVKAVKLDTFLTGDGVLVNIHDATLDRTMTTTGAVSNLNAQAWNLVKVKGSSLAPAWPDTLRPPALTEVFDLLEQYNAVAIIQAKTASAGQPLADLIVARGMADKVMFSSDDPPSITYAKGLGLTTNIPIGSAGATLLQTQAFKAAGNDYVSIDASSMNNPGANAAAAIPNWVNAGIRVIAYGVQSRYGAAQWLANGAIGIMSDDAVWVSQGQNGTKTRRTTDPFALKTWWPGQSNVNTYASGAFTGRGAFTGTNKWTILTDSATTGKTTYGFPAGYICPIATPTAYNLNWNVTFDALDATATAYHFVNLGATVDRLHNGRSDFYKAGGYEVNLGQDGNLSLWKSDGTSFNGGAAYTQVGTTVATGLGTITAGTTVAMKVQTTSTQIIVSVNGSVKITASDSTFRGGFVYFGRGGCTTASTQQLSLDTVVVS